MTEPKEHCPPDFCGELPKDAVEWFEHLHQQNANWKSRAEKVEAACAETEKKCAEMRNALQKLDKEIRVMATTLLKAKRIMCPDSDSLHWEGVAK